MRNWGLVWIVAMWGCAHSSPQSKQALDEDGEPVPVSQQPSEADKPMPTGAGVTPEQNDAVEALFRRKAFELQRCWTEEYEKTHDRKLEVDLTLQLMISPAGQASNVRVLKAAPHDNANISGCVTKTVAEWSFPEGPATVPYRRTVHLGAEY